MKVSEIARYWAAKELTTVARPSDDAFTINVPLSCERLTFEVDNWRPKSTPVLKHKDTSTAIRSVSSREKLASNTFAVLENKAIVCLDAANGLDKWLHLSSKAAPCCRWNANETVERVPQLLKEEANTR